jgi:hypothetical protein
MVAAAGSPGRAHLEEIPVRSFADLYMEWLDAALGREA